MASHDNERDSRGDGRSTQTVNNHLFVTRTSLDSSLAGFVSGGSVGAFRSLSGHFRIEEEPVIRVNYILSPGKWFLVDRGKNTSFKERLSFMYT